MFHAPMETFQLELIVLLPIFSLSSQKNTTIEWDVATVEK